jgi:hypothetical protein
MKVLTYISDLAENEMSDKKVPILFLVIIEYYNLVNSGKEQSQTTHGDRYDENRPIVLLLVKVYFITVGLCNR